MLLQKLLHLSLIENVGPAPVLQLMTRLPDLDNLYSLSVSELHEYGRCRLEKAQLIYDGLKDHTLLDKELELIEKHDIAITTIADDCYPPLLKNTHLPPIILYTKGPAALTSDSYLAIVGSRKADHYGAKVVSTFIPELVRNGWSIVSGGALGIDTNAHKATIEAGGKTIAVLGSGLLKLYPLSNCDLFRKITDSGGAVVSPYPLLMEPLPINFPARNRIISGLSRGCLVVQAAARSGALITAQFAMNEGRDVFAVPGPIDNPLSAGCHKIISQGATIVTCPEDILEAFGQEIVEEKQLELIVQQSELLTPEQKIIQLCAQPISFEELSIQSGIDGAVIQDMLCELSLDGKVLQNRVGLWCRY